MRFLFMVLGIFIPVSASAFAGGANEQEIITHEVFYDCRYSSGGGLDCVFLGDNIESPNCNSSGAVIEKPGDYTCVERSSHIECTQTTTKTCVNKVDDTCSRYPTPALQARCRNWRK